MFLCSRMAHDGRTWAGFLAMIVLAALPAVAWYWFAYDAASPSGPHGEHIFYSVRQSAEAHWPPHPLLWSPDFYRQLLDDLTSVVLTPIGFVLALAGLLDRRWRQHAPWLAAMVVLVLALPRKFYEMDYYFMAVLPPLCVMIGLGWQVVWRRLCPGRVAQSLVLMTAMVLSLRYAVRPAFVTPEEDRGVLGAAKVVRDLTAEDEPVVTVHGTGIDLIYYCRRPGWAVAPDTAPDTWAATLEDCRRQGARYLVVVGEGPTAGSLVAWGDNFRIHRLTAH